MQRLKTNFVTTVTLALLAGAACRDATAPVQEPPSPPSAVLGLLTGDIVVTATTTGSSLDATGYTVTLDLISSRSVATNGSVTFPGVLAGAHVVGLSGVAANCTLSGSSTRVVTLLPGTTARVGFTVSCAPTSPTTGNLTVTTGTTGSDLDPDGYTVTVDGTTSSIIGINGSVTFTGLAAGDHSVALSGVAGNCTVGDANPRTVTVTAGGTASTTFSVSCAGTPPPGGTRVTGRGAMGPGTATPESDRQEFDFEATDAPAGRAVITDYSVVRPSGSVGRMIVDRAADPATGVTAFGRTATACVRFEGMGRLDTGELWRFIIDACDNGSPGAGADSFTVTLPDRMGSGVPFVRSGTLREGDIVISTF